MHPDWTRISPEIFEKLCHDLVRLTLAPAHRSAYSPESMPQQADFQRDGVLDDCEFENLKPPVFFSYKTSDPLRSPSEASRLIKSKFLEGREVLLAGKPKSVVLWANHNMPARDKEAIRKAIPPRVKLRIDGRDQLEYRLFQHPFLLTKYFGWSDFVSCWHSGDRTSLRGALLGDALANSVPLEGVRHPTHLKVGEANGKRLRIVGSPGCGKSFFLYQLLATFEDADVVLLRSLVIAEVSDHLGQLVHSRCRPLVIIIDNLHDQVGKLQYLNEVLGILLGQQHRPDFPVTVLIAHWSSKRLEIERDVPQAHWDSWGFEEVNLDNPPRGFISEVVKAACEHLQIEAEEGMQNAFVDEITGWDNTPACAVASLRPYRGKTLKSEHGFHPVTLKVRDAVWRQLFMALLNDEIPEIAILLRTLSVLRWCGTPKPDLAMVREVAMQVAGATDAVLLHAVERLERAGWVHRDGATLQSHDLQIFPPTVGLHENNKPSLFLARFAELVLKNALPCLAPERVAVLHHLGQMFWNIGLVDKCVEFSAAILATDPRNVRALCNRGVALAKIGKTDEGLADLRSATDIAPSEVGPARLLYRHHRWLGQRPDALSVLGRLQRKVGSDAVGLAFLSQSYSDLREPKKALRCAERLIDADPKRPESHGVQVQTLWMAGRKADAKVLLDKALTVWPHDGGLLFIAADVAEQEGRSAESLAIAERALTICPNNPSIYALVAWLHITRGNIEKASAVAEVGAELFRFWPDLLTVRGMTLEHQGKLHEALQVLQQAVDRSDYHSGFYWPNLLLGLAKVHFQLGNEEQAECWFAQARQEGVAEWFIYGAKARLLQGAGKLAEAIAMQESVVAAAPDNVAEWVQLADMCMMNGRSQQAVEALRRADSLSANEEGVLDRLGLILTETCQYAEAVDVLRKLLAISPNNGGAWRRLGKGLQALSKHEDAARSFEKAIEKGETSLGTHLLLGLTLRSLGKQKEAVELCRRLRSHPEYDSRIELLRAVCLFDIGRRRDALRAAEKAERLAHDNEEVSGHLVQLFAKLERFDRVLGQWRLAQRRGWASCSLPPSLVIACMQFLAGKNRDEDLLEFLRQVREAQGPNETVLLNQAVCAARLSFEEEAMEAYTRYFGSIH